MTASAIAPVSLDPVLVLVCVARTNVTHQIISETRAFAINILREGQEQLASLCASSDPGHHTLQGCAYHFGVTGVPILHETLGYLECRLVHAYPGGDHTIFVGEVVDMGLPSEGTPLLWYNRRYARLSALPEE
jgi:flavin reductase (DIM6/NTAB) family NADH-FMN oxidoreductase RutF